MVSTLKLNLIQLNLIQPNFTHLARWIRGAVLGFGLFALGISSAQAVTLSRPLIQSTLGAPLSVEIDLSNISAEESVDLQATLALESSYKAVGISLNTALEDAKLELLTRKDQSRYVRITGTQPVSDPYVEVIVDLKWATGGILRNFGLFLGTQANSSESKIPQTPIVISTKTVNVKSGDTAGRIALQNMDKRQLSLDQMLIALMNSNPDAFIQKNVNLVKAGVTLKIPSTEEALAISSETAHSEVILQAKAFGNYKSTLAAKLPLSEMANQGKSITGKVSGKVQESTPAPKDQLKLSSPEIKDKSTELPAEQKIAEQKQSQENEVRKQNLLQNIEDLSKLAQSTGLEVKSGLLSGLPNLTKINNLDDLNNWMRDNFVLVYIGSFILSCALLLFIWLRINARPSQDSPSPLDPHEEEIGTSAVFQPLQEPQEADSIGADDPHFEVTGTNPLPVAPTLHFDFDLNLTPETSGSGSSNPGLSNSGSGNSHLRSVSPESESSNFESSNVDSSRGEPFKREPTSPVLSPVQTSQSTASEASTPASKEPAQKNAKSSPSMIQASSANEHEDPFRVRLDLAEELWKLGQKHTGRALAQEVAEQANEQMQEIARRWLSEHP